MKHHAAYGLSIEEIDAVVVEDSRPMQTILRSILLSFKVARVRVFDSVDDAMEACLAEPPNVILTDWRMAPTSGFQFLRMTRHRHMEPLCYVPILFITAHGTRSLVDKALRAGAHHVLVKPVSPSTLFKRLQWLVSDDRPMILENTGFYNIYGIHQALNDQAEKLQSIDGARLHHRIEVQKHILDDVAPEDDFEETPDTPGGEDVVAGPDVGLRQQAMTSSLVKENGFAAVKDVKLH